MRKVAAKDLAGHRLLLGVVLVLCCSGHHPTGPEALNEKGFPSAVGNRWTYRVAATWVACSECLAPSSWADIKEEIYSPDQLSFSHTVLDSVHWEAEATWEITARDTVLGYDAFRIETTHRFISGPNSGRTQTGLTWFATKGDTLWAVASHGVGGLNPVTAQLHKLATPAVQDEWGVNVLVFPLQVGREWDFGFFLFERDRKVVEAVEDVSVPAGSFEAFRVVRIVEDPTMYLRTAEWFAPQGVVKMADGSVDMRISETGQPVTYHQWASMELLSYQLK